MDLACSSGVSKVICGAQSTTISPLFPSLHDLRANQSSQGIVMPRIDLIKPMVPL